MVDINVRLMKVQVELGVILGLSANIYIYVYNVGLYDSLADLALIEPRPCNYCR